MPGAAAAARNGFDLAGAVLVTTGMLLPSTPSSRAPDVGWGSTDVAASLPPSALLAAFVANERRARSPLVPFSLFRIKGLAAANVTQLITFSGLYSMFFFLSLYMQNVLGYSPRHTGLAYLPLTGGFMISAGIATPCAARRHEARHRRRRADRRRRALLPLPHCRSTVRSSAMCCPGILIVALGAGAVFTGVTTAATDDVPADHAGLASGL